MRYYDEAIAERSPGRLEKSEKKVLTNGQNCGKIAERLAKGRENLENCIVQKLSQKTSTMSRN